MTTYKSTAVTAGSMPDFGVPAGVLLCRTGEYTTENDNMVSGDTIEMVPVPKYARIIDMQFYCNETQDLSGFTCTEIGDANSNARFFNLTTMGDASAFWKQLYADGAKQKEGYFDVTQDDTIDIYLKTGVTKVATGMKFVINVIYKMVGSISDES